MAQMLPLALVHEVRMSAGPKEGYRVFQKLFWTCAQIIPPHLVTYLYFKITCGHKKFLLSLC